MDNPRRAAAQRQGEPVAAGPAIATAFATDGRGTLPLALACGFALAALMYRTQLLNTAIFPVTSLAFPAARELQTLVGPVVGATAFLIAWRRPTLLGTLPLVPVSFALVLAGMASLALWPADPAGVTAGLMLRSLGGSALHYLLGLTYARLGGSKLAAASAACGILGASLFATLAPTPPFGASLVVDALLFAAAALLMSRLARPVARHIAESQGAEVLALQNPRAFLSPSHQLYMLIFMFSAAFGFALSLNIAEHTPLSGSLQLIVLCVVVAWFLAARNGASHEDALFAVAALLIVAGFLAAPLDESSVGPVANGLLYAGNDCFKILSWTAVAALCARNPVGSLLVLSCADIASGAGTFIGADLGHLSNLLLATRPELASLVSGTAVLGLFAYALLGLKGFSFAETIGRVESSQPIEAQAAPSHSELLASACDALAARCSLTDREREVLGILARGHNAYHIQEELTLSYNTVKTHVKRIYAKLDVHAQQELIELVETTAAQL